MESNGVQYPGATWREFEEDVSEADRDKSVHSALNHNLSFSMTKPALISFLGTLGFTTVAEVYVPMQPGQPEDRPTLVCQKGRPLSLRVFPEFNYRRDFDTAADTRGIQGRNVVFWNLPRKPAVEPQQEHIVATVIPPKPFAPDSVFGHAVANLLRQVLPEGWIQRIRRMIRGGTNK